MLSYVKVNNTTDSRGNEAESCDGKTKGSATLEWRHIRQRFVNVTPVKRLSRALAVAEGKQNTRCLEKVRHKQHYSADRNHHTENALKQIGRYRGNAGVEDFG